MEYERVETARTGWPQALAVALVMVVTGAWGAEQSSSFRVGLRIAASCRVDSAAVSQASTAAAVQRPAMTCDFGTPGVVHVTREPLAPAQAARGIPERSAVVVTLTF